MSPADGSGGILPQAFTFDEVRGSRVMFEFMSAQSGQEFEFVGLSEVRFEGTLVPEPMTALLFGLGIAGLLMVRRKK